MNKKFYEIEIAGLAVELPVVKIEENLSIALFNLHGNAFLTNHCAKSLVPLVKGAEILLTAESKGLQLCHAIATLLGHNYYAVARKSKKPYMGECIQASVKSITTLQQQTLYLSSEDAKKLKGKKVAIIDDVISTGASLEGLVKLVKASGGIVLHKAAVLAEGSAKERADIRFLASIPLFHAAENQ